MEGFIMNKKLDYLWLSCSYIIAVALIFYIILFLVEKDSNVQMIKVIAVLIALITCFIKCVIEKICNKKLVNTIILILICLLDLILIIN